MTRLTSRTWLVLAALVLAVVAVLTAPRVAINVRPSVLLEGQAIRLRCTVAKDPANRYLEWGIADYRESRIELNGEDAPSVHEWVIARVPCDVGPPFCRLRRVDDKDGDLATAHVIVTCGP